MAKEIYNVIVHAADILDNPQNGHKIGSGDSQIIYGERFEAMHEDGDFIYGTSLIDGYKGYVKKAFLEHAASAPSHFIDVLASHIYPEASFKTRPLTALSFLSRLHVDSEEKDGFIKLNNGGWVFKDHIKPIAEMHNIDPVETAMRFAGVPYLYGGRTSQGLDCSALIQLALLRNGAGTCPRDSGDQAHSIGAVITTDELQRGDLVFFPGHVGVMKDAYTVINATARKMATVIEPLKTLVKEYGPVTAARRP